MRFWLLLCLGVGAACSGHPPRQSGALGVFNPRGLEQRLMVSAEIKADEHTGREAGRTPR
jgi:hypothetical protein